MNSSLPEHIAIILDGNGRWAEKQGKNRSYGHQVGSKVIINIMFAALKLNVKFLTVYAFSLENWKRPKEEVDLLMKLIKVSINDSLIPQYNIRFRFLGISETLPAELREYFLNLEDITKNKKGMTFTVCVSYSSRQEITSGVKALFNHIVENKLSIEQITENDISHFLPSSFLPSPDLIIRTGGEYRLSNFMLWQSAYSELYFMEKYWPEFVEEDLLQAIRQYQKRERRFGGI